MKRLFLTLAMLMAPALALGAGTCTVGTPERATLHGAGTTVIMVEIECTADAAAATFPDSTISNVGGSLIAVYIDDGTTGITDDTVDVTVKMAGTDIDLLGGEGTNIDTTGGYTLLTPSNTDGDRYIAAFAGDLTLSWSGNAVNSADPTAYLLFMP